MGTTRVRDAAARGWIDGFTDTEMRPAFRQPYYKSLLCFSMEKIAYLHSFLRSRLDLEKRIREGKAQRPGSIYDPSLDDGRGARPIERFGKWAT